MSSNPGGGDLGPGVRLPRVPLLRGELRQAQLAAVADILQVISAIKKDSRTKLTWVPGAYRDFYLLRIVPQLTDLFVQRGHPFL